MNDLLLQMLYRCLVQQAVKDMRIAQSFIDLRSTMDNLFGLWILMQYQIDQLTEIQNKKYEKEHWEL